MHTATHPCADHIATCDHCYMCDVLGICCCSPAARSTTAVDAAADDVLTERLLEAAEHDRVLGHDLMRAFSIDNVTRTLGSAPIEHFEEDNYLLLGSNKFLIPDPAALPAPAADFIQIHTQEVHRAEP